MSEKISFGRKIWNAIKRVLVWWDNQTIGTQLFTWRNGNHVGTDSFGNKYYTGKGRRWVIFNGPIEGSRVPAEWHGWLHHTFEKTPIDEPLPHKAWEKPYQPNLTGTDRAYHPKGSLLAEGGAAPRATYEAWQPE